jgi:hypothetical protein
MRPGVAGLKRLQNGDRVLKVYDNPHFGFVQRSGADSAIVAY